MNYVISNRVFYLQKANLALVFKVDIQRASFNQPFREVFILIICPCPCLVPGPTDAASGSVLPPHPHTAISEPTLLPFEEGGEQHCVE